MKGFACKEMASKVFRIAEIHFRQGDFATPQPPYQGVALDPQGGLGSPLDPLAWLVRIQF